eukprot:Phypoly_transcript_02295.p1 GENE.Phypoly_transcript_02295~~Phypoly_transcript_02295.p1  ORF type:complete len:594 (+),score=127.32 Phypoly_transcript_02295:1088-2869(+)
MGLEEDFVKKIQALEKGVLQNKQNANNIVKLMKLLEVKGEAIVFLVIKSLQRIFTHFINKGELTKTYDPSEVANMVIETRERAGKKTPATAEGEAAEPSKKRAKIDTEAQNGKGKESAEQVFNKWILTLYNRYVDKLLTMLWHQQGGIQTSSLNSLFHFIKLESRMQCKFLEMKQNVLQPHLLLRVLTQIITYPEPNEYLLNTFCDSKLKVFHDIQYVTYWTLSYSTLLPHKTTTIYSHEGAVCKILNSKKNSKKFWMKMPDTEQEENEGEEGEEGEQGREEGEEEEKEKKDTKKMKSEAAKLFFLDDYSMNSVAAMKKRYTESWLKFLNLELSKDMLKQILNHMNLILPLLSNAFLMMDFLNKCYARGGVFSILALNGIFIEITKFNLDFPHFYKRLYALFDTGLLHTKYRGNFFKLASRFMFSKYLPSYTAAAFVKKVMRLALTASPAGVMLAMAFAHNVMQIHPSTQVLLHRTPLTTEGGKAPVLLIHTSIGSDPFDSTNTNPAKCSAINSSLWELLPFMNHQSPTVAKMAQAFRGPLDQPPYDFEELSGASYATMFTAEIREPNRSHPVNFVPKKSLFDAPLPGWVLPK